MYPSVTNTIISFISSISLLIVVFFPVFCGYQLSLFLFIQRMLYNEDIKGDLFPPAAFLLAL